MKKTYCNFCEDEVTDIFHQAKTIHGFSFCSSRCMSAFYGEKIPGDEDFISDPRINPDFGRGE